MTDEEARRVLRRLEEKYPTNPQSKIDDSPKEVPIDEPDKEKTKSGKKAKKTSNKEISNAKKVSEVAKAVLDVAKAAAAVIAVALAIITLESKINDRK